MEWEGIEGLYQMVLVLSSSNDMAVDWAGQNCIAMQERKCLVKNVD
jgi:hypothetical protein